MKAVDVDEVLKILFKYGGYIFASDEKKYTDMVDEIANLKALSAEPCDDAISRQAAKKALEDRFMELQKRHSEDRYETNFCLNTILELPPVTPKQKMGRWIKVTNGRGGHECGDEWLTKYCPDCWEVLCSECGARKRIEWTNIRYCPMCGAKMSENPTGSESEDTE